MAEERPKTPARALRWIRNSVLLLVGLLLVLGVALWFLLATEAGLRTLSGLAASRLGDQLSIAAAEGRLIGPLRIEGLRLRYPGGRIEIPEVKFDWSPLRLLSGEVYIDYLELSGPHIQHRASAQPVDEQAPRSQPTLPIAIAVRRLAVRDLHFEDENRDFFVQRMLLSGYGWSDQVRLNTLQIAAGALRLNAAGSFGFDLASEVELSLDWTLEARQPGDPASAGHAQLDGTLQDYRFDIEASLQAAQIPAGDWQAAGTGNLQGVDIDSLQGALLDGRLNARGQLDWQPALQWDLRLSAEQLNPGTHWEGWQGTLSAQLESAGSYAEEQLHLSARLAQLEGQLRGYPLSGHARMEVANQVLSIQELALQTGDNRLQASGRIGERYDVKVDLRAKDLAAVAPGLKGAAEVDASVQGTRTQPRLDAQLRIKQLAAAGVSVDALTGELQLHWLESASQSIRLRASDIRYGDYHFADTTLSLLGPLKAHRIQLLTRSGEQSGEIRLNGGWFDPQWRGRLEKAQWDTRKTGAWTLAQSVSLRLGATRIQVPEVCWLQQQTDAKLCAAVQGDPAQQWQASSRLQNLPLTLLDNLLDTPLHWSSRLDGEIRVSASQGRLRAAKADIDVSSGSLTFGAGEGALTQEIDGITLDAALDRKGVEARLHLGLAGEQYLDSDLRLPGYEPLTTPWKTQPLSLSLQGRLRDLAGPRVMLEDIADFSGRVDIDLAARGTLGRPVLSGDVAVEDGDVAIHPLGIQVRELQVAIRSEPEGLLLEGSALSGEGHLSVEGRLALQDITQWSAELSVKGEAFEAVNLPEAVVLVSPDLQANIRPPAIELQGEVHIPEAHFEPKELPSGVTVSRDVVIVDERETEAAETRWKASSRVRVSLGKQITLDGFGVKGELAGSLELRDEPGRVTRGSGALAIEEGTYTIYGRELEIVKGQLLFGGGPVDNPGLDFRAERVVREVHAGVRVTGTLKEPEVSLYSDPAMSDADILSYITLGRPAAQAGEGGGSPADALALAGGSYIAGGIGESLGLEEFKVESSETAGQAALVLGTYLSPQLYVRYSAGLGDAANLFEALYELSDKWSLRAQAGQNQSAADVIFSFER